MRREAEPRRPEIGARGVTLEQIRRVERHSYGGGELALGSIGRQSRDLRFPQIHADLGTARERHQLAYRHPGVPRIATRLLHHPRYEPVWTLAEERFFTLIRFNRGERVRFRPAREIAARLEAAGMSCETRPTPPL